MTSNTGPVGLKGEGYHEKEINQWGGAETSGKGECQDEQAKESRFCFYVF